MNKASYLLDANTVVRFLAADDSQLHATAAALVQQAETGDIQLTVMPWVVVEVVEVPSSGYGVARPDIAATLQQFINAVGVMTEDQAVVEDALDRYASEKVGFGDALLTAYAGSRDMQRTF
mgnify:CR=1 FL=1